MDTAVGSDEDDNVLRELMAIAEKKKELSRREAVAVRKARHAGLKWGEIGFLIGVTKQTVHRKYKRVG